MNLNFYNLPIGNLPYEDIQLCKQMMLRLYENVPFLPELPLMNPDDDVFHKTVSGFPWFQFKDGKLIMNEGSNERLLQLTALMEKIYNSAPPYDLDMFSVTAPYFEMYIEMLKRIKPKFTVINLLGPFTLVNSVFNKNTGALLSDKAYRKLFIYIVTIKALWFISKIKEASPETKPLIIFDERLLIRFGTLKRTNENITKETITTMFAKTFSRLRKEGAYICVQSFEKCNWQILFDTNCIDMISFDSYNNPSSLNILAPSVNEFLAKGGYINWGIVPVMNETVIRSLSVNMIYDRLMSTLDSLYSEGVSMDLMLKHSTVSIQGDLCKYPILFAEKAHIMVSQLADKLAATK